MGEYGYDYMSLWMNMMIIMPYLLNIIKIMPLSAGIWLSFGLVGYFHYDCVKEDE